VADPQVQVIPRGVRVSDAWRGLGLAKARAWELLCANEGLSTSEVATALKVVPDTARHHLAKLAEYGLAERLDDGTWVRGPADPEAVAEEMGTAGAGEAQRQRHELERQMRTKAREAFAAAASGAPFSVDPETGEVIELTERLDTSPAEAADEPAEVPPVEHQPPVAATLTGPCRACARRTGLADDDGWLCSRCRPHPAGSEPAPAVLPWAPELPPGLFDLPLDQVEACRVCRATTVTADGRGAICRACHLGGVR
jgi:DNA-binding transcriptional ArsR family regulator